MLISHDGRDYLEITRKAVVKLFPDAPVDLLLLESPRDTALADLAVPMFALARTLKLAPQQLAQQVFQELSRDGSLQVSAAGPYVNFFMNKTAVMQNVVHEVMARQQCYGYNESLAGQKIMIEFSGPNTNKPLHLGHLRNNSLGESLARVFVACGADVFRVNIINDRGVHICKSMLAYQMFGEGKTPESEGIKSDHFVGEYYVKYAQWAKDHPEAEALVQEMLNQWEEGDAQVRSLWQKMNDWALGGMQKTYDRTGITFNKLYFESHTYQLGKNIIMQGLEQGVFEKKADGSIALNIDEISHHKAQDHDETDYKLFLRKDGTSVYISQDLGTAVERQRDYPFTKLIYVVANEQKRHFEILFYALRKMGYAWAKDLYHLSYGMVNLPDGKMKSREGTVVDADNLLDDLEKLAQAEIDEKGNVTQSEPDTAFKIGLGALHYYLLHMSPFKDMLYDSRASLSFNGATGPYLQYTVARINSLLRKSEIDLTAIQQAQPLLQPNTEEWQLFMLLANFPAIISKTAQEYAPNVLTSGLYDMAKIFSKYYHETSILSESDTAVKLGRLQLALSIGYALRSGMQLLNIPILERM